jgi:hypothetical protein
MSSSGSVILVDHATEYLAPLDRPVERNDDLVVVVGWSLLAGLVRAVLVVTGWRTREAQLGGAVRRR